MQQLPPAGRVYVALVILAGGLLFFEGLRHLDFEQPVLLVALVALSALAASVKVTLPLTTSRSTMSVSYPATFASLLLLGPDKTMVVAGASALSQCLVNRKAQNPLHRTLFSMASLIVTVQCGGRTLHLLGDPTTSGPLTTIVGPVLGAATVYFLVNTGLVATAIALSTREKIAGVWHANFLWSAPSYFVGAGAAAIAAWFVTHAGYWLAVLMFAPVYLVVRTYQVYLGRIEDEQRYVQETSDLHLATVEALARAIEAKDHGRQSHVRRLQLFAVRLAEAVNLPPNIVQAVKTAALLHDIGKLAVPEHILSKPGPLSHEEFQKIRVHPQVGAEIIATVPFPYPVAPLILCHHERWDGGGYPNGLAGEDIPLGARVLAIVDYYDAVTTERPYHKAMSHESAVALLSYESGRALDPALVGIFIDRLPALTAELTELTELAETPVDHGPSATADTATGAADAGPVPSSHGLNVYENIALAHREIYSLYEIAQTMGTTLGVHDTMAVVSSKLTNIVPWSTCAVYLVEPDGATVRCHFARGIDRSRLLNRTVKVGSGLSGWVFQHRRSLVNADPNVSFAAAGAPPTELKSALVCPLRSASDQLIGCLALYHLEASRYTDDHRRLLERVAEQAGPVIANSITFAQTREDSLTDPLTSLPNRRALFAHLSRELARAERLKREVGVLVMDVDHFKSINDSYGHHVGDCALRQVAMALQSGLRPYDLCVRYAGDEFVVVLAECTRELIETRRRELQERAGQVHLEVRPGKFVQVGASVGAALYPHDGTTYEALIATADHRMYRDKTLRRYERSKRSRADHTGDITALARQALADDTVPVPTSIS